MVPVVNGCPDLQHADQFGLGYGESVPVGTVHHINNRIRVGIVTPPVWPERKREKVSTFKNSARKTQVTL